MTANACAGRLFGDHFLSRLNVDEQAMVANVRRLARDALGPRAAEVAQRDVFAWDNFRLLAREGVIGTAFPREYGGTDARQVLRIRIIEELGRVCSASASLVTGADLSCRAIVAGASDDNKARLLPALCRGDIQAAFALTEPGAGSDVRGLSTTIRREGDDYVINGRKKFITRGTTADWFMVVGRAAHDPSCFIAVLVPRDAAGFAISPEVGKLGWAGVPISSLQFKDVRAQVSDRLGAEGDGFDLAQDALIRARMGHASMALGRAIGAVEIAAAYMVDRKLFGKSLGEHQGAQWMVADMVTQLEAARALVHLAAEKYDSGDPDAGIFASMAKLQATDLGMKVVTDALQLTGGRGYLQDFPLERFFRDAKLNQIGEGSSEVHKTVIGRDAIRRVRTLERHPCLKFESLENY
ncbi:acyl-CoA dehydrogenase [Alicycliphilus denitrificans]|uniref:3-sulfinopropanoyl-CoA desulfinase n=2 Tax=Alicycliphilus denitrificans TaxID=179636 RepID=F4GBQ6_ALIDK|nr:MULTISPECIES: acyl-CoA dehydrogenase family protein [Burkholderiales]GAO25644.1 acyl-CoA dehydrogenase [Alicycliphilus sp. B1]ADV02045.1 acyl-CoA dehydrogenase domain-containing protein [Alicycliphilus denitrificans BC]AEB86977.1 Acyl-CoA dehydrogenase [Alicycliphilus denitrificans K601]QKD46144.1 acyl-CoA dehydrogenase [Alicycliphilus denitrificans]CAB3922498.1 Acryloyl-CoA reductase (NADH) [Achromobacter mucicolens]